MARPWPVRAAGVPLGVVLYQGIRTAIHRSLANGFRTPIHNALADGGPLPACWYGQQDAAWAALARSCGWWWSGENVCVGVDRPELVRTEPVPGTWHDEVRLRRDGVRYRDGWHPLLT